MEYKGKKIYISMDGTKQLHGVKPEAIFQKKKTKEFETILASMNIFLVGEIDLNTILANIQKIGEQAKMSSKKVPREQS